MKIAFQLFLVVISGLSVLEINSQYCTTELSIQMVIVHPFVLHAGKYLRTGNGNWYSIREHLRHRACRCQIQRPLLAHRAPALPTNKTVACICSGRAKVKARHYPKRCRRYNMRSPVAVYERREKSGSWHRDAMAAYKGRRPEGGGRTKRNRRQRQAGDVLIRC